MTGKKPKWLEDEPKKEIKEESKDKPILGVRFRGESRGAKFVVSPSRTKKYVENGQIMEETTKGIYLFTDSAGETGPVASATIVRWYLNTPVYHYDLVPVWPGVQKPGLKPGQMRPIGSPLLDWERVELEKLADYLDAEGMK